MARKQSGKGEGGDVIDLVHTSVLIPGETRRKLRIIAAHNDRSLSVEIRAALEAHVKRAAA